MKESMLRELEGLVSLEDVERHDALSCRRKISDQGYASQDAAHTLKGERTKATGVEGKTRGTFQTKMRPKNKRRVCGSALADVLGGVWRGASSGTGAGA